MRLLLDQNLSPRLVVRLAGLFPDSNHVSLVGLDRADDGAVWEYARRNGFSLVAKDADFGELSTLRGFPPKVVWLRRGDCTTAQIEGLLRLHFEAVRQLMQNDGIGILSLL